MQSNPPKIPGLFKRLGPGLVTGASKNDPASITTYIVIGARTGYQILWTMLFSYPLLAGIQEVSALIGRVTGRGIAGNVRRYYSKWLVYCVVLLLAVANIFNIGADLSAMAAAARLIVPGPEILYAVLLALASLGTQMFVPYTRYVAVLKWLTLALFAYVATVFVVHVQWSKALSSIVAPKLTFNRELLTAIVAAMGATINPYLLFWQASQEVEEVESTPGAEPLKREPAQSEEQIGRIQLDTYVGMAFSNVIGYFIILTATVTLYAQGHPGVQSPQQAAEALRPIAGNFAFLLFSAGIIGSGLLGLPVLAGSAAYAAGEALRLPVGLQSKPSEAKEFYLVLSTSMLIGLTMTFFRVNPVRALYASSLLNGIAAVPLMVLMMLMSDNPRVMGNSRISPRVKVTGWIATIAMMVVSLALVAGSLL